MKLAITSSGKTLAAAVDPRFGRSAFFLVYDTDDESFAVLDNAQNLQAAQGAGIQAAETVCRAGAEAVITGHCGPKAFRALHAAGIAVFTGVDGSVTDAIASWRSGGLQAAGVADVEPHW